MKKLTSLLVFIFISTLMFAQVQRKTVVTNKSDSASITQERKPQTTTRGEKKQMIRDLNLNKDQKSKLKEVRQSSRAKKETIEREAKSIFSYIKEKGSSILNRHKKWLEEFKVHQQKIK